MKRQFWILGVLISSFLAASCGHRSSPQEFLAWSMDQHKALKAYSSKCAWKIQGGLVNGDEVQEERTFAYKAPNQFRIVSKHNDALSITSVSDGNVLLDYSSNPKNPALSYGAPDSISSVASLQMEHPAYCGTLLYRFFGGSSKIDDLVDQSKAKIQDGGEETLPNGGTGRIIHFFARGPFGNASALIDEKTGMVDRLSYDAETWVDNLKQQGAVISSPTQVTEQFSDVQINSAIDPSVFKAKPPAGIKIQDAGMVLAGSPVPIGKPAPDFTVVTLDGKEVKLSSLRGKPVFLDFWATWCEPCKMSLPHTERLAAKHGDAISVLAISTETPDKINSYEKDNHFNYKAYRDPELEVAKLYNVDKLPTFVTIDAKGNLIDYRSGYAGDEVIDQVLSKVGIKS